MLAKESTGNWGNKMINPHPQRERISCSKQDELWQEKRGAQ
jgi:hypothetical protein